MASSSTRSAHEATTARGVVGRQAESWAREYLEGQGWQIVTQNFRCRQGEIDLVAEHNGTIAFVEVRYRSSDAFADPASTVTPRKRARIVAAAKSYLMNNPRVAKLPCRFDVLAITGGESEPRFEWLPHAFDTTERP